MAMVDGAGMVATACRGAGVVVVAVVGEQH